MSSIANIQNIIDEHKTSLPEGSYLELCEEMLKLFEESKTINNFYKLTYVCSNVKQNAFFNYEVVIQKKEKIVQMTVCKYETLKHRIDRNFRNYRDQNCKVDIPDNDFVILGTEEQSFSDERILTGQDHTITITNDHIILAIEKL